MTESNVDKLVGAYVKCRDGLAVIRADWKTEEARHKAALEVFANKIMELADAQGVESFKTKHGTAFKKKKDFIQVKDWPTALEFMVKKDLTHLLTKSVAKAAAKEYMAENDNTLPPGLEYGYITEINIRRK